MLLSSSMASKDTSAPSAPLDKKKIHQAQQNLVNAAIAVALDMAYEDAEKFGKPMKNTYGASKEAVLKALIEKVPNDRERVRVYNQLVKPTVINFTSNFDLSLKSNGEKSIRRTKEKADQLGGIDKVSDIVRLTAVSGDVHILDDFAARIKVKLEGAQKAHSPSGEVTSDLEGWFARKNLLLSNVLKSQVDGFNAEIQFLPRQQARLSTRVTHKYYEVIRLLDKPTPRKRAEFIENYNKIAEWINDITAKKKFTGEDVARADSVLLNDDYSQLTFDTDTEGSFLGQSEMDGAAKSNVRYSSIFKNPQDLADYAGFMRQLGEAKAIGFLPLATLDDSAVDLKQAQHALFQLSQATHGAYIKQAPEPMKDLFASEVAKLVQKHGPDAVPGQMMDFIGKPLGKNEGTGHGRS